MKRSFFLIISLISMRSPFAIAVWCVGDNVQREVGGRKQCVPAPKKDSEQPKPESKPSESSPTADKKDPATASDPKTTADKSPSADAPSAANHSNPPSSSGPGFSQADVIRRQKYADELARERDWNRMKDRESLDIRMRQFQGNHQNMRVQITPPIATPYVVGPFSDPKANVIGEIVNVPNGQLEDFIAQNPDYAYYSKGSFVGGTPLSQTISSERVIESSDDPIQDLEDEGRVRAARLLEMQSRREAEREANDSEAPDLFTQIGLTSQGGNVAVTINQNQTIAAEASAKNEKSEAEKAAPALSATFNNNISTDNAVAGDDSWEDLLTNTVSRAKTWIFGDESPATVKGQNPPQLRRSVTFVREKRTKVA